MQLYVFSSSDFQKIATAEEAEFAKGLFENEFK